MSQILIVDDSETVRSQVRKILEDKGYKAVEAIHGKDGLAKLESHKEIKLILCDVNMPEMNGIEMCQAVKKNSTLRSIPILMLTTEANVELKKQGKEAGVVAWMTKPLEAELLIMAVNTVLGKAK